VAEGLGGDPHEGASADGGEGGAALGDAEQGVEAGEAGGVRGVWVGYAWEHSPIRGIALGREGFRFSGPNMIETKGKES